MRYHTDSLDGTIHLIFYKIQFIKNIFYKKVFTGDIFKSNGSSTPTEVLSFLYGMIHLQRLQNVLIHLPLDTHTYKGMIAIAIQFPKIKSI